jgi:hypothetical protein
MPQPASDFVLGDSPRYQISAMESDMFRFSDWVGFLLGYSLGIICVRHDLMQLGQKILM